MDVIGTEEKTIDLSRAYTMTGVNNYEGRNLDQNYDGEVLGPFVQELKSRGLSGRVLDVACGVGESANLLEQAGMEVTRLEISEEALTHQSGQKVMALAPDFPFAKNSFGGVHIKDALLHIEGKDKFLDGVHSILAPGGLILVTTLPRRKEEKIVDGVPYFTFDVDQFEQLAATHGFRSVWPNKTWTPSDGTTDWYAIRLKRRVLCLEKV